MKYGQGQLDKWIDKALAIAGYDVTIEEIHKEEGDTYKEKRKPKDYQPYYLKYPWKTREDQEKWYAYIEKEVRKLNPHFSEDKIKVDMDFIDCLISLSEINILSVEEIVDEPVKVEKV